MQALVNHRHAHEPQSFTNCMVALNEALGAAMAGGSDSEVVSRLQQSDRLMETIADQASSESAPGCSPAAAPVQLEALLRHAQVRHIVKLPRLVAQQDRQVTAAHCRQIFRLR